MPSTAETGKAAVAVKLAVAGGAASAALLVPLFLLPVAQGIGLARHFGYWIMLAVFLLYLFVLVRTLPRTGAKQLLDLLRDHLPAIFVVLLAGGFLQLHSERGFHILFDEHVLSSTAMSMHYDQTAYVRSAAHFLGDEMLGSIGFVDKRPLLFPFILSLVHGIFGYDHANVFWLNGFLAVAFLALLYALVCRVTSRSYGILAVLLFAGLPLLAQNATGGGYELINLCLIATLCLSAIHYLSSPGAKGLDLLVLTAVLLANTRYETVTYVLVPVALFALKSLRERRIELGWIAALSPLLLILPLTIYNFFQAEPRFIQTTHDNFFHLSHLPGNLGHAVAYLFDPDGRHSNSVLISLLGVPAAVFIFVLVAGRSRQLWSADRSLAALLPVLGILLFNTLLALSHWWGAWTDPLTSRFSLPLHFFLVLVPPIVLYHGFGLRAAPKWLTLAALVYALSFGASHAKRLDENSRLTTAAGYSWAFDWITRQSPPGNHLYLAPSTVGIVLLERAALPFALANEMPERVLLTQKTGLYDQIYVFESLLYAGSASAVAPSHLRPINPRYRLETVAEQRIDLNVLFRLSRVTGLEAPGEGNATLPSNLPPPAASEMDGDELRAYLLEMLPLAPRRPIGSAE